MTFNDAVIAKMTIKKVLHQLDQTETLLAVHDTDPSLKLTLADWFTEMRVHLRRLETSVEMTAA
jgi:hypothetical protein